MLGDFIAMFYTDYFYQSDLLNSFFQFNEHETGEKFRSDLFHDSINNESSENSKNSIKSSLNNSKNAEKTKTKEDKKLFNGERKTFNFNNKILKIKTINDIEAETLKNQTLENKSSKSSNISLYHVNRNGNGIKETGNYS